MAVYLTKRGTINVSQNIHLVFYRRVSTVMSFTEGYSRHHRPFIHLLFIRPRCHRGSIANSSAVADVSRVAPYFTGPRRRARINELSRRIGSELNRRCSR